MNTEKLAYNLQFFADESEPEAPEQDAPEQEVDQEKPEENDSTAEQIASELAKEKLERQKIKAALDKALKENGEIKKQLRAKQTQQEIEDESKREAEEAQKAYVKELEDYKKKNEAKERYLLQGMDAELAAKAAEAEVTGDMDALSDINKQYMESVVKAKEAEWKKSRPQLNAGDGSGTSMTKEEIMAIKDPSKRQKAIAENLDLFK